MTSVAMMAGVGLISGPPATALDEGSQQLAGKRGILTDFGYDATAYGSKSDDNTTADSDATAVSHLPCTRYVPRDRDNHVANSDQGGVTLRNVDTHNFTRQRNGVTSATSVATAEGGKMAGGAVRFTDLRASNRSLHERGEGFRVEQVSSIGSLEVSGVNVPIPSNGRTFTVPVPGRGDLVVNERKRKVTKRSAVGTVNVLKFVGTDGTVQRTAHAQSRIDGNVEGGVFQGGAVGSRAVVADTATSKKGAAQPIPCPGTFGKVLESSTGEANPTFGVLGARRSFAYGVQRDNRSAEGYTRSIVESASFGALTLRNIRGRANVTRQADGDVKRNARGTGVGSITVAGQEQDKPPAGEAQRFPGGEYT
ncbi:MAG: hypothetical protein H0V49_11985, partial [Nocardioidaceae bacterium]|nr:hypothetical protein [Nocardioidaceae bacterium]